MGGGVLEAGMTKDGPCGTVAELSPICGDGGVEQGRGVTSGDRVHRLGALVGGRVQIVGAGGGGEGGVGANRAKGGCANLLPPPPPWPSMPDGIGSGGGVDGNGGDAGGE